MIRRPPRSTLFPYTPLSRSCRRARFLQKRSPARRSPSRRRAGTCASGGSWFTLLSRTKLELAGISNFNPVFPQEATPAALSCQAQLARTPARADSRAAYQDFLTLWKGADPDISILRTAKAEYAKLR